MLLISLSIMAVVVAVLPLRHPVRQLRKQNPDARKPFD